MCCSPQPPALPASWGSVLLLDGEGGVPTASRPAEGPPQAARSGAETRCTAFTRVVPFNGAEAESPPRVTQASVPSHLTQLFALLQLLLQLKRPAKEGEQRRFGFFFFLSYDQDPNSTGPVGKGIKRTTEYKASQGVGERLVQGTALPCLAVRGSQSRARASRGHPRSGLPRVVLPGAEGGVQIVCQGLPMDWMCSLAFIRKAAMLVLRGSASSKGNLSTKVAPHW